MALYKILCNEVFSFQLGKYLEVESLGHVICNTRVTRVTFVKNSQTCKGIVPFYILIISVGEV